MPRSNPSDKSDRVDAVHVSLQLTQYTSGALVIKQEEPFVASFKSPNGLEILAGWEEPADPEIKFLDMTAMIAFPMERSAQLDHWVAGTSRTLPVVSLGCLDAGKTGYGVQLRGSILGNHIDVESLGAMVTLMEVGTYRALDALKAIDAPWARPIRG